MSADQRESTPPDPNEQAFLAAYDAAEFPRPSVAVDVALVTLGPDALEVLLLQRDEHPARGAWALPGGFVALRESLEDAARRVLQTKAGLDEAFLEQLFTFGAPDRDPRARVISIAYYALVDREQLLAALNAEPGRCLARLSVPWEGETGGPVLALDETERPLRVAFDHAEILGVAVKRLRGKLDYSPIGFELLPDRFTLRQLQTVHEVVLGKPLNKDSFRRRMLASGMLAPTGVREAEVGHRPAELYRIKEA